MQISIGLQLLTVAMERGIQALSPSPLLVALVEDDLCRVLLALVDHSDAELVAAALRVLFLILEARHDSMKFQLERLLEQLMEVGRLWLHQVICPASLWVEVAAI